jgi:hypothetical protein
MSWLPEFTSLVELGKPQEAEAYLLKIQVGCPCVWPSV